MNPYRKNLKKIAAAYKTMEQDYSQVTAPFTDNTEGDVTETYVGAAGNLTGFDDEFSSRVSNIMLATPEQEAPERSYESSEVPVTPEQGKEAPEVVEPEDSALEAVPEAEEQTDELPDTEEEEIENGSESTENL